MKKGTRPLFRASPHVAPDAARGRASGRTARRLREALADAGLVCRFERAKDPRERPKTLLGVSDLAGLASALCN
jgi:hypothetical protein